MDALVPVAAMATQTVTGTAAALTGVTQGTLQRGNQNTLWLTAETVALRYRWDGTSPTGSVGHLLPVNTPLQISGRKRILAFRMAGDGGGSSVVTFTLDNYMSAGGVN